MKLLIFFSGICFCEGLQIVFILEWIVFRLNYPKVHQSILPLHLRMPYWLLNSHGTLFCFSLLVRIFKQLQVGENNSMSIEKSFYLVLYLENT